MKKLTERKSDYHLRVYEDRSELMVPGSEPKVFEEGELSPSAIARYSKIVSKLQSGFLEKAFIETSPKATHAVEPKIKLAIDGLIGGITSEVGRAMVALLYLQLVIKSIEPRQSIRLHKGSERRVGFGWKEGLSMRTIDSQFVTPFLRKHKLIKLNKSGLFMTRSLAENYPYSRVYKAESRGGKEYWLDAIDLIESDSSDPYTALLYMTLKLQGEVVSFGNESDAVIRIFEKKKCAINSIKSACTLLKDHMDNSDYAARIMEIGMHSLLQALGDLGHLGDLELVPLSQMRSANKKHGNVGDIELKHGKKIIEAWDAKYGKDYLRDEIEELRDKLADHDSVKRVGFVTSKVSSRSPEIQSQVEEVSDSFGVEIAILTFEEWANEQTRKIRMRAKTKESELANQWILAYIETLSLKRPEIAPIDEPSITWLKSFGSTLQKLPK